MANVKNFGLIGVGSGVQFGKSGPWIDGVVPSTFNFRAADNATDASITAAGITSSAGNVTLTTGNLVLTSTAGSISIGGDTTLTRAAPGVFSFGSSTGLILPTVSTLPTATAAGQFIYNSGNGQIEYWNGSTWVTLATGGVAVTAVSVVPANGFTGTSSGGTTPALTLTTSVTGILYGNGTAISAATAGEFPTLNQDTIGTATHALNITGGGAGEVAYQTAASTTGFTAAGTSTQVLTSNGAAAPSWTNVVNSLSGGTSGLTVSSSTGAVTLGGTLAIANGGTGAATAIAAFNALAPATVAGDIIIYGSGSTNTALGIGTEGQMLTTVSGLPAWTTPLSSVTVTTGTGLEVTAGTSQTITTAGTFALTLSTNLVALSGLTATPGFVVETSPGVFTTRDITGTTNNIVVTYGDGVASSPTIDLAPVTQGSTGTSFVKVNIDSFGRVIDNTAVTQADLTGLISSYYLPESGGTMSGAINMGGHNITNIGMSGTPANTDVATVGYVNAAVANLNVVQAVDVLADASSMVVTASGYTAGSTDMNGGTGIGALLTDSTAGTVLVIDGHTVSLSDRILVTGFTAGAAIENGIYTAQTLGVAGTTKWVLIRETDYNDSVINQVTPGNFVFVTEGTAYHGTGWVETALGTSSVPGHAEDAIKIGTDAITFSQFSGTGSYSAGTGLTLAGTVFSVNYGAGIEANPTNDIGINLFNESTSGLILTTDGTTRSDTVGSALALLLPAGSGLTQDATGLHVTAAGITNAMLASSSFTLDGGTGTSTVSLGGTLSINGTAGQIDTVITAGTATVSIDAGYLGQTSITTLGTITTGIWNGSAIAVVHGGTGLTTAPTSGQLLVGNSSGGYTLAGLTGGAGISITPGSGSITIANTGLTTFSGGTTGLTPSTPTAGAVVLAGTLATTNGGTGLTSFVANEVFYAGSTSAVAQSSAFTFDGTSTLTIGGAEPLTIDGDNATITATATDSDITLNPNGTGVVVIGPSGVAGFISSDPSQALTVTGQTTLTLTSGTGNTTMVVASGKYIAENDGDSTGVTYAASIVGHPTALVNKYYVDTAIANFTNGVATVSATISLAAAGSFNIGSVLPAGATILSVKVKVTTADTATGTLVVGKSGGSQYMLASENDTQTTGIYIAEDMVTEATAVQVQATVAGTPGGAGSATIFVMYAI